MSRTMESVKKVSLAILLAVGLSGLAQAGGPDGDKADEALAAVKAALG